MLSAFIDPLPVMMESKDRFRDRMEILQSKIFWVASVSERWGKIDTI